MGLLPVRYIGQDICAQQQPNRSISETIEAPWRSNSRVYREKQALDGRPKSHANPFDILLSVVDSLNQDRAKMCKHDDGGNVAHWQRE